MMTFAPHITNDELDHIIAERGGLFVLLEGHQQIVIDLFSIAAKRFSENIEYTKRVLYSERPRDISFGLLLGTEFNAFAYASPEDAETPFDFVGMNWGLIFTFHNIFVRILAHPDNFPSVGASSLETPTPKTFPYLYSDLAGSFANEEMNDCAPRCPVRSAFAHLLSQVALDFVFFHEITHLRNGHLEYISRNLGMQYWAEASGSDSIASNQLIRQTLEWDADCGAILHTLNRALEYRLLWGAAPRQCAPEVAAVMDAAFGSNKLAVATVHFVAYVVWRIFDVEWAWHLQDNVSHPLPAYRLATVVFMLHEISRSRPIDDYSEHEFMSDSVRIVRQAEEACAKLTGAEPDFGMLLSVAGTPQQEDYITALEDCWREIRPTLEEYKRGGKLAP